MNFGFEHGDDIEFLAVYDPDLADDWEERAAIMQFCGGLSPLAADAAAWADVVEPVLKARITQRLVGLF